MYIWNELTEQQQNNLISQYKDIKYQIKKLNSEKANKEKICKYTPEQTKEYNEQIKELQSKYDKLDIYYKCNCCGNVFKTSLSQIKTLFKDREKLLFCSRKCSGIFYAIKSHKGKTKEQELERNKKISETLKNKETKLTETQKQQRLEKYEDENYNNTKQSKQINICKNCNKEFTLTKQQELNYTKYNKLIQYCCEECGKQLIEKYLKETDLKRELIAKELGISMATYDLLANKYNLKRTPEQVANIKMNKMKSTMLEKYGVTNAMEKEEFKHNIAVSHSKRTKEQKQNDVNKAKQTKLEKYGDPNYHNIDKAKQTMIEKYGVDVGYKTDTAVQNRIEGSMKKFGVDNALKSKEVHNMAKQKIKDKYGVESVFQLPEVRQKCEQTWLDKYGETNPMKSKTNKTKLQNTMIEKYGVTSGFLTENAINSHKYGTKSNINNAFAEQLRQETGLNVIQEIAINNIIYDIQIGDNLLIDINPTISHNVTYSYPYVLRMKQENIPIAKDYHFKRYQLAVEKGYTLISIFDWMDVDKIINIIKAKLKLLSNRIYANKCVVKEIDMKTANEFLDKYHLQGGTNGQTVCIGLFYKDELIQVQTFGKPRFNKKYDWEAIRLATKMDTYIIGGVSKGFKYFINKYNPKNIVSYNSLNISSGNTDSLQGFKQVSIGLSESIWVNTKNNDNPKYVRNGSLRRLGIDKVLHKPYDYFPDYDGTFENSNEGLMIKEGYVQVFDCGQVTYLWTNNE